MLFNLNYENKLSCFLIGCKVILHNTRNGFRWFRGLDLNLVASLSLSHACNTLAAEIDFPSLDQFWCTQEKTAEIEQDLC